MESTLESSVLFSDMRTELPHYAAILDTQCENLKHVESSKIRATGYVVDTLEAALWCLCTSSGIEECVLKAVNLGDDTDTVGAVAGGLSKHEMIEYMAEEFVQILEEKNRK